MPWWLVLMQFSLTSLAMLYGLHHGHRQGWEQGVVFGRAMQLCEDLPMMMMKRDMDNMDDGEDTP